jgi:hypothetical protein
VCAPIALPALLSPPLLCQCSIPCIRSTVVLSPLLAAFLSTTMTELHILPIPLLFSFPLHLLLFSPPLHVLSILSSVPRDSIFLSLTSSYFLSLHCALTLSLSLSHSHTLTLSLSLLNYRHTHTHTLSLSLVYYPRKADKYRSTAEAARKGKISLF